MERKLIKQGGGGLTIYLPKKWTDAKKLKEGDSVQVAERESSLVIGSSVKENRDIVIELDEESKKRVRGYLTHSYRKGFNKIILKNVDDVTFREIKRIVNTLLLGFGITDRTGEEVIIENISEPTEQKYDVFLNRVFFLIKETFNDLVNDFSSASFKNLQEISDMRDDVDKHILYCRRTISRGASEKDPIVEWELLTFLMQIEHSSYYLYEYVSKNKINKDKDIISLVKDLRDYFEIYHKAYAEKDFKYNNQIQSLKKSYHFGKCIDLLEKSKGSKSVVLAYLKEIFRLIQVGTSPILVEILEKYTKQ